MSTQNNPTESALRGLESELTSLLRSLIPDIHDDCRATDDPDDDRPGMQITVGVTVAEDGGLTWNYQTGDNSFTGGAYGHPVWGVGCLYVGSDPAEVARQIVDDVEANL